jgi:hypothetical protein
MSQTATLRNLEEYTVSSINAHHGKDTDALFELIWKTGDHV